MKTKRILIVGVGGQGTLLSSKLLGKYLLEKGYDIKTCEVHGMSQRGGSVVTCVSYGEKVFSPVIEKGEADLLLSFEQLESARWLPYLKKDGVLVTNTQKIEPMSVITGSAKYPENILEKLSKTGARVLSVDALALSKKAGSEKSANVVLLGAAARLLGIDKREFLSVVEAVVPPQTVETNVKAFEYGFLHTDN